MNLLQKVCDTFAEVPDKILLHGQEGSGKTTFAASMPDVIFIASEDGVHNVHAKRFPIVRSWAEILNCLTALLKQNHSFRSLAIDSLTWAEQFIKEDIKRVNGWSDEEAEKYFRWLKHAPTYWMQMFDILDQLVRTKRMNVCLVAHSKVKKYKDPAGADYNRWRPDLGGDVGPETVTRYPDCNLFLRFEDMLWYDASDTKRERPKASTTGRRVLCTTYNPAWDAKNRYGLPPVIPGTYAAYREAKNFACRPTEVIFREALGLLEKIQDPAVRATAEAFVRGNEGQRIELNEALSRLKVLTGDMQ